MPHVGPFAGFGVSGLGRAEEGGQAGQFGGQVEAVEGGGADDVLGAVAEEAFGAGVEDGDGAAPVSSRPMTPAVESITTARSRSSPTDLEAALATRSSASLTPGSFSSTSEKAVWKAT
ncbi:hypothetical protein GCM10027610_103300 [Dactylosporangium cerinum]